MICSLNLTIAEHLEVSSGTRSHTNCIKIQFTAYHVDQSCCSGNFMNMLKVRSRLSNCRMRRFWKGWWLESLTVLFFNISPFTSFDDDYECSPQTATADDMESWRLTWLVGWVCNKDSCCNTPKTAACVMWYDMIDHPVPEFEPSVCCFIVCWQSCGTPESLVEAWTKLVFFTHKISLWPTSCKLIISRGWGLCRYSDCCNDAFESSWLVKYSVVAQSSLLVIVSFLSALLIPVFLPRTSVQ